MIPRRLRCRTPVILPSVVATRILCSDPIFLAGASRTPDVHAWELLVVDRPGDVTSFTNRSSSAITKLSSFVVGVVFAAVPPPTTGTDDAPVPTIPIPPSPDTPDECSAEDDVCPGGEVVRCCTGCRASVTFCSISVSRAISRSFCATKSCRSAHRFFCATRKRFALSRFCARFASGVVRGFLPPVPPPAAETGADDAPVPAYDWFAFVL